MNDFAVYNPNNVLSHIFVALKTEFQVPTTRIDSPILRFGCYGQARHVLCKMANGLTCICV